MCGAIDIEAVLTEPAPLKLPPLDVRIDEFLFDFGDDMFEWTIGAAFRLAREEAVRQCILVDLSTCHFY